MTDFLPKDYDVPKASGNYMKFQDGVNRFRALASPIVGWETWKDTEDGGRKPIRTPMNKPFTTDVVDDPANIKHFWALPVWNYQEEKVQILEITQKSIQKTIKALAADADWGSPINYDLVITKTGQKLETEYAVQPKPAKKLDEKIKTQYEMTDINLNALFTGEDPFKSPGKEDVNPDEVPV